MSINLANQPVRKYPKSQQLARTRVKPTQRQMGDISTKVDKELKQRSGGICEHCRAAEAVQRAHIIGRKQLNHKTTVDDLLHVCVSCHKWLDETPEGIRYKKSLVEKRGY